MVYVYGNIKVNNDVA